MNVLSLTFSKTPLSTDGPTGHNNSALPLQLVKDGAPDPPRLRPLRPRLGGGGGGILLAGVVSRHERGDRRRRRRRRLMSKVGLQGVDRLGGDAAALARVGAGAHLRLVAMVVAVYRCVPRGSRPRRAGRTGRGSRRRRPEPRVAAEGRAGGPGRDHHGARAEAAQVAAAAVVIVAVHT